MRRIAIFRDGSKMCAMIGPDWVEGLGGFGDTVPEALRDLAAGFTEYGYGLQDNMVMVEVAGRSIQTGPGANSRWRDPGTCQHPGKAGFPEDAYPEPDWEHIGDEKRLVTEGYGKPRPFIVSSRN